MSRNRIAAISDAHRLLAAIVVAFVALAFIYSVVTPIFEAGDEIWHYPFVQYLAYGHSLPVQDPNVQTLWEQEGGQPPLYYALGALTTFWIDTRDLPDRLWRNPEARIGIPLDYGNKNLVVHTSAEDLPWGRTTLAVHLLRFVSILLSAFTIVLTYLLALEINPRSKPLAAAATALVAFNPMFLFISASVNNDNLAVCLATLSLLLLTRLVTRGATLRRFFVLGLVLGMAALSKVSDLGLIVIAAFVFVYLGSRVSGGVSRLPREMLRLKENEPLRIVVVGSALCAAIALAVAGWWYSRNGLLYGDPLAFNVWVAIAGGRPVPASIAGLLNEFQGFRISYWGNFGGVNIIAPEWVYTVLDAFAILAGIGLGLGLLRRSLPRLLALPAAWLVLILLSLVRWTLLTFASQGRLIFPAISAVAILMAYGLWQLATLDLRSLVPSLEIRLARLHLGRLAFIPFALVTFLFLFSLFSPFALIAPAYALPARLPESAAVPNQTHITFDDQAELVGYEIAAKSVSPGGRLPLTLYWRARTRMTEDYSVYIRLFDVTGKIVGRWDAFPGRGLYPTRLWQPGEIVVDEYRVPLAVDAVGPGVGRVEVGLFRRVPLGNLTARDPQGQTITPTIARFKVAGQSEVRVEGAQEPAVFGEKMALVGHVEPATAAPGKDLSIKLYWRALAAMDEDYTVFVHLVDANGTAVAHKDDQPDGGKYPTSFWDVGETVADGYVLALPPDLAGGDYQIEIGVYRAGDGSRLPIRGGGDALTLGVVRVVP